MLRALIGFLCLCVSIPVHAKLGETVPQLIKRFGKSYTVEEIELCKTYKFRSSNVSVDAVVVNGVSAAETYFSDHPLTASGEPPNEIVRAVLKTNVPKARWLEIEAAPFRADYTLRSSDGQYVAILNYTGPQPENMIWTMTVARAEVVRSLSIATPSPVPAATPALTPVPPPAAPAAPVNIASPKPSPHIEFSPEQLAPSPASKPLEPPTPRWIGYVTTSVALFIGALILYVIALAKAFRSKKAPWIVAALLTAVLAGSMCVVVLGELRESSQQPRFANQVSTFQGFVRSLYSRLTSALASKTPATQSSHTARTMPPPESEDRTFDLPALAARARRAIVLIVGYNASGKPIGTGSGFFVSAGGRLVTNWHVVDGIAWAQARAESGATYDVRGLLASSPLLDLAVLQADAKGVEFLAIDSTAAEPVPGTRVAIIGSPLALEGSLSEGIVSANRSDETGTWLQVSAPISPGSSGSPVLDVHGRVIGVATWTITKGQNLNFARSAHDLVTLLKSIRVDAKPTNFVDQLAADPDFVASNTAAGQKDFTLALKLLNRVRQRFPRNSTVLFKLGVLYGELGLFTDAAQVFYEYVKIDPTEAAAWANLAIALSQSGNFQEAISACYEAIKLQPDDAGAWKTLARCLYRTGDYVGAKNALQKADSLSRARAKQPKATATPAAAVSNPGAF
jgi:S1-C subfamily serine protease